MFFGAKGITGKIVHAGKAFNDVRLHIDLSGSSVSTWFKGKKDLHLLNGKSVKLYLVPIKNAKEKKEEK